MRDFFIDTADERYIRFLFERFDAVEPSLHDSFRGITTNPNAMSKIGARFLDEWAQTIRTLNDMLHDRYGGEHKKEIHFQIPATGEMEFEEIAYFVDKIRTLCVNASPMNLGLKISPKELDMVEKLRTLDVKLNVTGLSDYASVLRAASYGVDYASIIPGRMEEKGIDANAHLDFLTTCNLGNTEVITGSMRTLGGLQNAFTYHTVPTIGTRVWDKLLPDFYGMDSGVRKSLVIQDYVVPTITEANQELTVDFFNQMNDLGLHVYSEVANMKF